jgi:hypothetical protein
VLVASAPQTPAGYTELSDGQLIAVDRDLKVTPYSL